MTREDINDIINAICPNDEDYEKPCISPKYLRQELEQLALDQKQWNEEPTTKNDSLKYCDRNICLKNEYNNIGCDDCEVTKSQEPTTKNDLGVDCISREQAKAAIRDKFKDLPPRVEINTILNELPSVTPQEPRWIPVGERLPKRGKVVIVTDIETSDTYQSQYIGDGYWECDNGIFNNRIIAWMPLPKPYEPQESEDNE